MANKHEILKRLVILLYVLFTSVLLYLISLTDMNQLDEISFSRFAVFFWGGCFAFHYLNMLLPAPANENNSNHWKDLALQLIASLIVIAFTFGMMFGVAKVVLILSLPVWIYACLALFIFSAGIFVSLSEAKRFHEKLSLLVNSEG